MFKMHCTTCESDLRPIDIAVAGLEPSMVDENYWVLDLSNFTCNCPFGDGDNFAEGWVIRTLDGADISDLLLASQEPEDDPDCLFAHLTVDIVIPIQDSGEASVRNVRDCVIKDLDNVSFMALENYRIRSSMHFSHDSEPEEH